MKISGVWEAGGWYGFGVSPEVDADGQRTLFTWICVGIIRFEVFSGTVRARIAERLLGRRAA